MSDDVRIKATIVCGVIGGIVGLILAISSGYNFFGIIFMMIVGCFFGMGLTFVPTLAGWIWEKTEVIRDFGIIGFIAGLVIWWFAFAVSVWISPIISIIKFVKALRNVREDTKLNLEVKQELIEEKSEDWRDHF